MAYNFSKLVKVGNKILMCKGRLVILVKNDEPIQNSYVVYGIENQIYLVMDKIDLKIYIVSNDAVVNKEINLSDVTEFQTNKIGEDLYSFTWNGVIGKVYPDKVLFEGFQLEYPKLEGYNVKKTLIEPDYIFLKAINGDDIYGSYNFNILLDINNNKIITIDNLYNPNDIEAEKDTLSNLDTIRLLDNRRYERFILNDDGSYSLNNFGGNGTLIISNNQASFTYSDGSGRIINYEVLKKNIIIKEPSINEITPYIYIEDLDDANISYYYRIFENDRFWTYFSNKTVNLEFKLYEDNTLIKTWTKDNIVITSNDYESSNEITTTSINHNYKLTLQVTDISTGTKSKISVYEDSREW